MLKELNALQTHANSVSDIMVGAWWKISLSVVTPIVLGYMMFDSIKTKREKKIMAGTIRYSSLNTDGLLRRLLSFSVLFFQ
ncbi:hypothetical protein LR68_02847 [Anoxybacillus sp. BCO1]|nr:hypothetical protein LR68_02847 [Anoxybacillus sp. BCO1]